MKYNKFISLILLLTIIGSIFEGIYSPEEAAAATTTENVPFTFTVSNDELRYQGGGLYSARKTLTTNTISLNAGSGRKIEELAWYIGSQKVQTVAAASGSQTWSGTSTLNGEAMTVISKNNDGGTGGWYAWDRYGLGGKGDGRVWYGGATSVHQNTGCASGPPDPAKNNVPMWPGCSSEDLELTLVRNQSYFLESNDSIQIPTYAVSASDLVAENIARDMLADIPMEPLGITDGKTDSSTRYRSFSVIDADRIRIIYGQDFNNNRYHQNWSNPWAQMIVYFAKFRGDFKSKTYWYPATLRVTYSDTGTGGGSGTIHVRHMARVGTTGSYTQQGEQQTIPVATLPHTRSISANSAHGTATGYNVAYTGFGNAQTPGSSAPVSLTTSQRTAYVSIFYNQSGPPPATFSGDFDIVPSTINYREPFRFDPKNFVMNGCTYQNHWYKIERNGLHTTPKVFGQSTSSHYTQATYPWNIGVGMHLVSMKIQTSCGESEWIGPKTLNVNNPGDNSPPVFRVGFVHPFDNKRPLTQVVEGTVLDLIYIYDPEEPTPYDPDGDTYYFMGFDTSVGSSFIQSLPSRGDAYLDGYHSITMDTLGYHSVCGMMRDVWGANSTACTQISVVPKNPVPIPACPAQVKENRPVSFSAFSSHQSYSPAGRTIDHNRDEWDNRLTSYTNGTSANITVYVGLHVYDNTGLKSLSPGMCSIVVTPDDPPIAALNVPSVGIRNEVTTILNESYSPDGDEIVFADYKYKYDAGNDGFHNDEWIDIEGDLDKLSFTANRVGKYLFYVQVTEEFGRQGDTAAVSEATLILDIVNNAPEVSFDLEGNNPQPDLDPFTTVKAAQMLAWPVYETNSNQLVKDKYRLWTAVGDKLIGSEGRNFNPINNYLYRVNQSIYATQYSHQAIQGSPVTDNGYGANRLSPWRSAASYTEALSNPLINPHTQQFFEFLAYEGMPKIRSTKNLILFNYLTRTYTGSSWSYNPRIYALNPKKLSAVKETLTQVGFWVEASYSYTNGSPYDYILTFPSSRQFKLASGQTVTAYSNRASIGWELADGYIYASQAWEYGDDDNRKSIVDISIYDALTGQFVRSSYDTLGEQTRSLQMHSVKGRNLIMAKSNGNRAPGDVFLEWYELTPEMTLTKIAEWIVPPAQSSAFTQQQGTPGYASGDIFYDEDGAMYMYQFFTKSYSSSSYSFYGNYDMSVTKYNPDFSLAWRRYLVNGYLGTYGTAQNSTFMYKTFSIGDAFSGLFVNGAGNEVHAKLYYDLQTGGTFPPAAEEIYILNAKTGGLKTYLPHGSNLYGYHYGNSHYDTATSFHVRHDGTKVPGTAGTVTAEGFRTSFNPGHVCGNSKNLFSRGGYNQVYNTEGAAAGQAGVACNGGFQTFGEYFGDGVYVSMTLPVPPSANPSTYAYTKNMHMNVSVGTPTTEPLLVTPFTNGQFYSNIELRDAEMRYTFEMRDKAYDNELLGFSFRMSDPLNRYAVETEGSNLYLTRYIDGDRTVLAGRSFAFENKKTYTVKIKAIGQELQVWLNNIPILEATDETFEQGSFGYFSDKSFVTYGSLLYKELEPSNVWSDQYAIWDEGSATAEVQYNNILFDDPEDDPPAGEYEWSIDHTVRFINNQGPSVLSGQTFTSEQLMFDAVGDYMVKLKGRDDPHPEHLWPEMLFEEYRKSSNEFSKTVTVHRRPISDYAVAQGADYKVVWQDFSYDPDRYESSTHYSEEDTGIDYRATKGIMQKVFYYITPSGEYSPTKLVSPAEKGVYEVGMAVRDEYGAWSDYTVKLLDVETLPLPNQPPIPGFTTSHINTFRGVGITIDSVASDPEDGDRENLVHAYYIKNTTGGAETFQSASRTDWIKSFSTLGTFNIRQVVTDTEGLSAEFERQVTIHNRIPAAVVTVPESSDQNAPTRLMDLRPTFEWQYSDLDGDAQTQYQLRIHRYGGALQLNSNTQTGAMQSWIASADLPEKVNMYVIARVHDGYEWSEWSDPKYFYIETNRPPVPDFHWLPVPVYEGDELSLVNTSSDEDGDSLTAAWEIARPDGGAISSTLYEPKLNEVQAGEYTIKLTVSDGKEARSITKQVTVLPLLLSAEVHHTPLWLARHEAEQHETIMPPKDFYAGESLVLRAVTSDAAVDYVIARLDVTGADGANLYTETVMDRLDGVEYGGMLHDARWASLTSGVPPGLYQVEFEVRYSNGIVRNAEIPIRIIDNMWNAAGIHRRQ